MNEDTTVATIEQTREVAVYERRAVDFKNGVQLMSVEDQKIFLAEHTLRRNHFREWLLSQLIEGVHYGFPPGCEPKLDRQGRPLVDKKQWTAKPSLYKAGAFYIIELLKVRAVFEPDMETWEMAGKVSGLIFRKCRILNPATGDTLGEGSGAYLIGKKGMDANAAIKMAEKNSATSAVINTFALADLFTQDLEDQTSHTDESMNADFFQAVQEWVEELKVWPEYKVRKSEIMALRASLSIWIRGQIPNTAEAAMSWIRENVTPEIMKGKEGNATGLRFIVKREKKSAGDAVADGTAADKQEVGEKFDMLDVITLKIGEAFKANKNVSLRKILEKYGLVFEKVRGGDQIVVATEKQSAMLDDLEAILEK